MENILAGTVKDCVQKKWPLDEQLTISNLLVSRVLNEVSKWNHSCIQIQRMKQVQQLMEGQLRMEGDYVHEDVEEFFRKRAFALKIKEETETIKDEEACLERKVDRELRAIYDQARESGGQSWQEVKLRITEKIQEKEAELFREARIRAREMNQVLGWIRDGFGKGTAFLMAMESFTAHKGCMELICQQDCPIFEENCEMLMTRDREKKLREKIEKMQATEMFAI